MKLPFLASFLGFILFLSIRLHIVKRTEAKKDEEFWARERKANSTRKKTIDNLPYVIIPETLLNIQNLSHDASLDELLLSLNTLSQVQILNLTGLTNTDLKLAYGTANISFLTECDNNYTLLATSLQEIAEILYLEKRYEECIDVLEFAISTETDISRSYYLLATLYKENSMEDKIPVLIEQAESLTTLLKPSIVQNLKESYQ